jgi:hypothetical protein
MLYHRSVTMYVHVSGVRSNWRGQSEFPAGHKGPNNYLAFEFSYAFVTFTLRFAFAMLFNVHVFSIKVDWAPMQKYIVYRFDT